MRADIYTSGGKFHLVSLSIQVPQNRGKQCCSIVLSFNNNTINLSAAITGFIFPNDHSQQQHQQQFIQTHRIPISFFSRIIRIGNGNAGSGGRGYEYQRQQLRTLTFGGTHGGSATPENVFLSPDSLRWTVSDVPRDNTTMSTMTRILQMRLVMVYFG